ncbi:sulfotransferase domain-containing protein [Ascidiaceihabitans sp.]|nr:sulfotransferase domain-containing protein [Ascidiaceihabitans sp.]
MIYPNLVIAGAPKCGTTSLHNWLSLHPSAFGAKEKELRYLMDANYPLVRDGGYNRSGLDGYARYFETSGTGKYKCIFETTPDYIYQNTAIEVLASQLPETRVAFILRRPADRVLSMFKFTQNNISIVPANMTFLDFIKEIQKEGPDGKPGGLFSERKIIANSINHSRYAKFLEQWYERISPERISIWRFEELAADPKLFMKRFATYFGLEQNNYDDFSFTHRNESFSVKSQKINRIIRSFRPYVSSSLKSAVALQWTRTAYRAIVERPTSFESKKVDYTPILENLDNIFEADNRRLETLTGLDFSCWSDDR